MTKLGHNSPVPVKEQFIGKDAVSSIKESVSRMETEHLILLKISTAKQMLRLAASPALAVWMVIVWVASKTGHPKEKIGLLYRDKLLNPCK